MKIMMLKEVDEKENNDAIKKADKLIKKLEKELNQMHKEINSLTPHSRIYFLNDMIGKLIGFAELPRFVVISILDGLKIAFQLFPAVDEKIIDKQIKSYVG